MSQVTELLDKARSGDDRAWDQAVALVYDDLKRIARGVLGGGQGTLNPTAMAARVSDSSFARSVIVFAQ